MAKTLFFDDLTARGKKHLELLPRAIGENDEKRIDAHTPTYEGPRT
jgi:DNA-binding sugar fermentation-stimulating protein